MSEEVAATLEVDLPEEQQEAGEEKPKADDKPKEDPKDGDGEAAGGAADGEAEPPVKEKPQEEEKPQQSDPEEPEDDVPIVLVTGASGYLASHVVQQLLQDGRFRVRGTIRNLDNEKKVKFLRELVPEAKYPLRLIEADLLKPKTWAEAVRRCRYVAHVASPLIVKGKAADGIKPAVEGTTSVLKACAEAGTVRRVVVTSSTVTVVGLAGDPGKPADHVFTEADFASEEMGTPYEKSKVRAERAAWEFVKGLEKDKQFELAVVCPGLLEGPLLNQTHQEGSVGFLARVLAGKMSRLPDIHFALADVRDTARAHIAALEKAEAAGNRYISYTEVMSFKEMAQILADEFKPQGYKIGVKNLPKAAMWAAKLFNSQAKTMYTMVGKKFNYSNEKMKGELGVEPRPAKDSIIDTGYSIIEMGIVPKKPGYLGHPSTRPPPTEPTAAEAVEGDAPQEASSEPAKTEEKPAEQEPAKADEAASEQTKTEEPAAKAEEPQKTEEPTKAEEATSEEPTKVEETPSSEEPAKEQTPSSEEPAKEEQTPPSEEPAKEEQTPPSEEPAKVEETPAEEPVAAEEPTKEEEPVSEPPKEEPVEATPTQEPETQEPEAKEEPPTEQTTTTQEQPEPTQEEDPPTEPTNDDSAAQEEQKESKSQDAVDVQNEAATDADTES
ncbi:Phenylacetaldehyde reductase [Geodia barretti]|uniref:Phenylacetaldehyde reductase n=1 Tax=Geodia barretti TaxID=519541 RepID=A0AA35WYD4_GEOBA|nr:Phenylacetaldehyde reductase [Geodia barretti]